MNGYLLGKITSQGEEITITITLAPRNAGDEEYLPCLQVQDGDSTTANWISQCLAVNFSPDADWQILPFELESPTPKKMKMEEPTEQGRPGNLTAPTSPDSSDSSYHRTTNPVPRHKRASHKRAELKRRDKIRGRLDDIKDQVPSIADKGKMGESAILSKAAEYTKHLIGESERFSMEAGKLRQEIESLSSEIHSFHEQLPATGLTPSPAKVGKSHDTLDHLYNNYLTASIKDTWKFYLFSFLIKPLFQSYKKEVSTDSTKSFFTSVRDWITEKWALTNLRSQTLESLRSMTRETDIMNHPESLPEQALASIAQQSTSASSPASPPADFLPVPRSLSCQTLAPVSSVSTISMATAQQGLASPLSTPISKSVTHHAQRGLASPLSTPISRSVTHLKDVTAVPAGAQASNPHLHPFKPVHTTIGKHGLKSAETVSASRGGKLRTVAVKPEFQRQAISLLAINPSRNFVPVTSLSSVQQPVVGVPDHFTDISQLAASVEETSLNTGHPTAVVAPSITFLTQPSPNVACLIDGSDYDFDLTDIPLPDLDENSFFAPQPSVSMNPPYTCSSLTTFIEAYPVSSAQPSVSNTTLNPAPRFSNGFHAQPVASSADVSLNMSLGLPPSTSS